MYSLNPSPDCQLFSNISKGEDDIEVQVLGPCISSPVMVLDDTVVLESAD